MVDLIKNALAQIDAIAPFATPLSVAIAFVGVLVVAAIAYVVAKRVIVAVIRQVVKRTATKRDDLLINNNVFERLSHLAPGIVIHQLGPEALSDYPGLAGTVSTLTLVYIAVAIILFLNAVINAALAIYNTYSFSRQFPITSLVQVLKMIVSLIGIILIISLLLGESPATLFTAMGALAAGFMFVFKDSILGFVAGIQLTANKMVAVGDWIEMPKYGVDGDVMEIAMTTVKIHNFDKTITTIPTYSLITDSFKNWRGMQEAGGRRIKRSIYIDVSSIRFCDEALLARLDNIALMKDYLAQKREELATYNKENGIGEGSIIDGRRLTNVGSFRAYLVAYLKAHPNVSQHLTLLVRQLKPTSEGLPIELYFFTSTTNWGEYENIQADIFDHIFAAAQEFGLRLFQNPTGGDFRALGE